MALLDLLGLLLLVLLLLLTLLILLLILLLVFCVLNESLHRTDWSSIIFILVSPCAIWNGVGPGGIIICC